MSTDGRKTEAISLITLGSPHSANKPHCELRAPMPAGLSGGLAYWPNSRMNGYSKYQNQRISISDKYIAFILPSDRNLEIRNQYHNF